MIAKRVAVPFGDARLDTEDGNGPCETPRCRLGGRHHVAYLRVASARSEPVPSGREEEKFRCLCHVGRVGERLVIRSNGRSCRRPGFATGAPRRLDFAFMLAQVHSFVLEGIDPVACEVEVDVADRGLAKTTIVGLPDAVVKESIERVRSAIVNSGYSYPMSRMLVNLAPADIRKEGPSFDLPIAVGLLLAEQVIQTQTHKRLLFARELALDGRLRSVNGSSTSPFWPGA